MKSKMSVMNWISIAIGLVFETCGEILLRQQWRWEGVVLSLIGIVFWSSVTFRMTLLRSSAAFLALDFVATAVARIVFLHTPVNGVHAAIGIVSAAYFIASGLPKDIKVEP